MRRNWMGVVGAVLALASTAGAQSNGFHAIQLPGNFTPEAVTSLDRNRVRVAGSYKDYQNRQRPMAIDAGSSGVYPHFDGGTYDFEGVLVGFMTHGRMPGVKFVGNTFVGGTFHIQSGFQYLQPASSTSSSSYDFDFPGSPSASSSNIAPLIPQDSDGDWMVATEFDGTRQPYEGRIVRLRDDGTKSVFGFGIGIPSDIAPNGTVAVNYTVNRQYMAAIWLPSNAVINLWSGTINGTNGAMHVGQSAGRPVVHDGRSYQFVSNNTGGANDVNSRGEVVGFLNKGMNHEGFYTYTAPHGGGASFLELTPMTSGLPWGSHVASAFRIADNGYIVAAIANNDGSETWAVLVPR